MTDCIWQWEQDGGVFSVYVCAREEGMLAKVVKGEDAVAFEVPYNNIEELKKKFVEALTALLLKRK